MERRDLIKTDNGRRGAVVGCRAPINPAREWYRLWRGPFDIPVAESPRVKTPRGATKNVGGVTDVERSQDDGVHRIGVTGIADGGLARARTGGQEGVSE